MKKETKQSVNDYIKENSHLSYEYLSKRIQEKLGTTVSVDAVRKRYRSLGLPNKRDNTQSEKFNNDIDTLSSKLYELLLSTKKKWTTRELTDYFNCGITAIEKAVEKLDHESKNLYYTPDGVEISKEVAKSEPTNIDQKHLDGEWFKFGFVTDNHLGSRYERLDVLKALYDIYEEEGVKVVYNAGNMIDGDARFNKYDVHKHGLEDQVNYLIEVYPQKKGMETHFITGDDHEGWYTQREGVNVGRFIQDRAIQSGRKDLTFLGHMEHDVIIQKPDGQCKIRVLHPGGGSSYAYSYTAQKIVESYTSGEKPNVLLIGHYHKSLYAYIRGVHCVEGGCTMDQSPFMRKKRLDAHVGGWIIEMKVNKAGAVVQFRQTWIPFFDKKVYSKNWEYKWSA